MLTDCHTHLDQFAPLELPAILGRTEAAGVGIIITAGTTLESCQRVMDLVTLYPPLYGAVGLHPMDLTGPLDDAVCQLLHDMAANNPKIVVISETGLDFIEGAPDRQLQDQAFRAQIRLAREVNLPLVVHSRDAYPELLRTLQEDGAQEVGGALHYFQGDEATAWEAIHSGFYISLAKPLLRLPQLQETAKRVPLEHIVLETDSAPQPWKRKRENWTEPSHVRQVAEKLAELKGITLTEVEVTTTANLLRMTKGRIALG